MKRIMIVTAVIIGLAGCQMTSEDNIDWQQDNQVELMNSKIELNSAVWIDEMPSVGSEEDESKLNLALTLTSNQVIDPDIEIVEVVIRQGEESWVIDEEEYDVRVNNNHSWEIAAKSFHVLDASKPLDIAVQVNDEWIIQANVSVDTVY